MQLQLFFVLITTIICVYMNHKVYKDNTLNRRLFYLVIGIWVLLILLSTLTYNNTLSLSLKTTCLLCLGNIALTIGFCLYRYRPIKMSILKKFLSSRKIKFNVNFNILFSIIQVILCMIFIYYFIKYQYLLRNLGIEMSRMIKFELGLLFSNKIESYIFQYLFTPLLYISIFFYCIKIFDGEKYNKKILILLFVNILLYSLIGQGRMIYFQLLLILIIFIFKKICTNSELIVNNFYKIGIFFGFLIVMLFFISLIRMGFTLENISRVPEYFNRAVSQAFIYFTGPFKGLDYYINQVSTTGNFFPGQFTFYVFFNPIEKLFQIIGLSINYDNPMIHLQQYIPLSQYLSFNALFTYYINFYMDFSYFGFIIMPLILGYFMAFLFSKINSKSISIRLFVFFNFTNLIMGILRWEYQNFDVFFTIVIILIIYFLEQDGAHAKIHL